MTKNTSVFFELLRAGLWKKKANLQSFDKIDYSEVLCIAEEQSVTGLVVAGLEQTSDVTVPQVERLLFIGKAMLVEQQNTDLNCFVANIVSRMRRYGIFAILVKGQGIAQCYERPLWRACGDVDFFLSEENYEKAKTFLTPLASSSKKESEYDKQLALTIDSWTVELHGSLRCGLSKRIDQVLDEIRHDVLCGGNVRSWLNGNTYIFLPSADNDAVYVFTHILNHFYKGGIGVRQFCDWCRLLWTYRDSIDVALLEGRLQKMKLVSEWKAFASFAVERLGMPVGAMPLYDESRRWKRKAKRIEDFLMMSGNFGHNRDSSYWTKYPYLIRKAFSMKRRVGDLISHARIFPLDSLRFFPNIISNGLKSAVNGE